MKATESVNDTDKDAVTGSTISPEYQLFERTIRLSLSTIMAPIFFRLSFARYSSLFYIDPRSFGSKGSFFFKRNGYS